MNDHDRDLLLGLVDGTLIGEEADAARARIEADPGLRAELARQLAVRAVLGDAPPPRLTEPERDRLRSRLRVELGLAEVAPAPRRRRPLRILVPALGGLATLVLVAVAVLPRLFGGSQTAESILQAEGARTVTTAAASTAADADLTEGGEGTAAPQTLAPREPFPEDGDLPQSYTTGKVRLSVFEAPVTTDELRQASSLAADGVLSEDLRACIAEVADRDLPALAFVDTAEGRFLLLGDPAEPTVVRWPSCEPEEEPPPGLVGD